MRSLPVFMYHHINWHLGDLVTLTPEDFENHLRVLSEKGVQPLFLNEAVEYLRGEKGLSRPAVALTFDDGHLDNWVYAFPLLKKYRVKATIFVITSWMTEGEKRNHWQGEDGVHSLPAIPTHKESKKRAASGDFSVGLRWEEAQAMEASGFVDIQSHTHWHRDYFLMDRKVLRLNPEKKDLLVEDLARSKELIQKRLGKKCNFLSWPWGKYDPEAVALAKKLGYEAMVTTEKGVNFPGSSEMAIKRIVAKSGDVTWFSKRLKIYSHRTIGQIYSRVAGKI
jgi:peptidoglycan/xylan/chitin deacetylase (PgdA/CDA1 family)